MGIMSLGTPFPRGYAHSAANHFFGARKVDLIQNALKELDRESASLTSTGS